MLSLSLRNGALEDDSFKRDLTETQLYFHPLHLWENTCDPKYILIFPRRFACIKDEKSVMFQNVE